MLWEKEVDPEWITAEAWQEIASRGFDSPKLFSAYLHTLQWNCVTSTDPYLFQSPFRAGIRIDAYQLEPLQKALGTSRVNLFIADDVGLGKTIEAGLIARELLLRKKVQDIVVACPPSMLFQWQEEASDWFWTVRISNHSCCKKLRNHKMGVALCASCPSTTGGASCCTVGGRATPAAWNTPPQVPLTSSLRRNRFPSCCTSVVCN